MSGSRAQAVLVACDGLEVALSQLVEWSVKGRRRVQRQPGASYDDLEAMFVGLPAEELVMVATFLADRLADRLARPGGIEAGRRWVAALRFDAQLAFTSESVPASLRGASGVGRGGGRRGQ